MHICIVVAFECMLALDCMRVFLGGWRRLSCVCDKMRYACLDIILLDVLGSKLVCIHALQPLRRANPTCYNRFVLFCGLLIVELSPLPLESSCLPPANAKK